MRDWGVLTIGTVGLVVVVEEVRGVLELVEEVTGLEVVAAVVDEEVVAMVVEIISWAVCSIFWVVLAGTTTLSTHLISPTGHGLWYP